MSFLWNSALQLRAASASMNSDLSPQLIKTTPLCPRSLFLLCNSDCASRQTAGVTGWGEGAVYLISCLSGITVLYCCCTMSKNSCSIYFCSDIQGFFLGGGVRMVNPLWPLKMLLKVNPYIKCQITLCSSLLLGLWCFGKQSPDSIGDAVASRERWPYDYPTPSLKLSVASMSLLLEIVLQWTVGYMCPSTEKWIKLWYFYAMEYFSAIKKQINAICSNMDGPRGYHTK